VTERRWSLVTFVVAGVAFVAFAAWRIPWHPVPGGMPPSVSELSVFTPDQIARANAFRNPARYLAWASLAVSLFVACLLGFTPLGPRLLSRVGGWWWVRVLVAVVVLEVIGRLVTLPFAIVGHHRALEFGLTRQAWGPWAVDQLKSLLLTFVVSGLLLLLLIGLARVFPHAWPAVAGVVLGVLVMLGSFVYPVLVEPAFNSFKPLPDGPLRTQIMQMAAQEHVDIDDVLVSDASRRTTTLNAYVSGYGSTRRVVIFDNTLRDLPEPQLLAIVAHELAHARYDDVLNGSILGAFGAMAAVGVLGLALQLVRRRPGSLRDPSVVPLVLALVAVGTLLASPVENGLSRQVETRADVTALGVTRNPVAFEQMMTQLALHSLSNNPPAWSQFWFGSHPTTLQRIAIARQIGPQQTGSRAGQ
jgi:STE24 endopeptidase